MPADVSIRPATIADRAHVARHRFRMFEDMGILKGADRELLRDETLRYLSVAMPAGEYLAWLAVPTAAPDRVIGGAGVQRRRVLPHPRGHGKEGVAAGNHAIVLNVFTEPDWRRKGVAQLLMEAIIEWADAESLDRLVLHASMEGRPLYERLGFVPTNEMRFNRLFGRW